MLDIVFDNYWEGVTEISYESGYSLLGYETVIWRPSALFSKYYDDDSVQYHKGYPILDIHTSTRLQRDIERRKREMLALLDKGKSIFIIAPIPNSCYIRSSVNELYEFRIIDALPVGVEFEHAEGFNLEFKGDELFKSFVEINKDYMKYYANIRLPEGRPFLYIKDTDAVVGTYTNYSNGKIVFIPNIIDSYGRMRDHDKSYAESIFIDSIYRINSDLNKDIEVEELPEWSRNYFLPNEREEYARLSEIQKQIDLLNTQIDEQVKTIKALEKYKVLFTGTGKPLEQIVKELLIELGFEVTEGLPGRDDLILKYNDKVAVVEVKGVGKSAAEKHAAQLEKWVSGYIEKFGIRPKGILIVNSFCKLPLLERTEDTFPNQMLVYSERREHALINTLQLLGAYIDVQKNPDIREQVIEEIFNTIGKLVSYTDWLGFIEINDEKNGL
ncbi:MULTISPECIES: hypothetical protein [unclassified Paenibacillus]|uniref:hypothetical protein n=1 Tax=unclassified Paenibacillus TaxID=185978 RepID=UPI0024052D4D|nr:MULTISPECIES: hypothetical protein [unclassified Paenibacillus]